MRKGLDWTWDIHKGPLGSQLGFRELSAMSEQEIGTVVEDRKVGVDSKGGGRGPGYESARIVQLMLN